MGMTDDKLSPPIRPGGDDLSPVLLPSACNALCVWIPVDRLFPEIGFVRHVACDGGVIAKDRVLHHRLPGPYRLEESVKMRAEIIPVGARYTVSLQIGSSPGATSCSACHCLTYSSRILRGKPAE